MDTKSFLTLLENNQDKALLFAYGENIFVSASYHITEIKNVSYETVDCGGSLNSWNDTVAQLWENPGAEQDDSFMSTSKALSIFKKVDAARPLVQDAELKFEYGNSNFHTANLKISSVKENTHTLVISLESEQTMCKAISSACCESNSETFEKACC